MDYGRKPYLDYGKDDDYQSVMRRTPKSAVYNQATERDSEFEKPYLDDFGFPEMQQMYPHNRVFDSPDDNPSEQPVIPVSPCGGSSVARIAANPNPVPCGGSSVLTMQGHDASGNIWNQANITWKLAFPGIDPGSISGNTYLAPDCDSMDCTDDTATIIAFTSDCSGSQFGGATTITIKGPVKGYFTIQLLSCAAGVGTFKSTGGRPPFTWWKNDGSGWVIFDGTSIDCTLCQTLVKAVDQCAVESNTLLLNSASELTVTGTDAPIVGSCYSASGGTAPYTWSFSGGTIDSSGCITGISGCGRGTVNATDANGCSGEIRVRLPSGTWIIDATCSTEAGGHSGCGSGGAFNCDVGWYRYGSGSGQYACFDGDQSAHQCLQTLGAPCSCSGCPSAGDCPACGVGYSFHVCNAARYIWSCP